MNASSTSWVNGVPVMWPYPAADATWLHYLTTVKGINFTRYGSHKHLKARRRLDSIWERCRVQLFISFFRHASANICSPIVSFFSRAGVPATVFLGHIGVH